MNITVVRAYDLFAMEECRQIYEGKKRIVFTDTALNPLQSVDGLVIAIEWKESRSPDFEFIKARLRHAVIFDRRNLYVPKLVREARLSYFSIERQAA